LAKKFTQKIYNQKNDPSKIDIQKILVLIKPQAIGYLSIDADEEVSPHWLRN